jgi:hypothetical protein
MTQLEVVEPLRLNPVRDYEDFLLINTISYMISVYTNAHMFFDLKTMPEMERLAEIQRLKDWMMQLLH